MILLSGFLDTLLRAIAFIGLAASVGGITFRYVVTGPSNLRQEAADRSRRRVASVVSLGGFAVGIAQFLVVVVAEITLASEAGGWQFADFLRTSFVRAGIIHALFGLGLGFAALRARSSANWAFASVLALLMLVSGAWLTHGASRLQNSGALMAVTVIHQFAASVWIGGLILLAMHWKMLRGDSVWPQLVARFSPLALGSVGVMVAAGVYLAWEYVGSFRGLVGTAYGMMLLTKIALMFVLLFLGGINNLTVRRWKITGDSAVLLRRVPAFSQVEAGVGLVVLMAAASLTGQPPAIDIPKQQATPAEVAETFAPKVPRFVPPPHAEMVARASSSLDPYALPSRTDKLQSDFNHNISGVFVILIGLAALVDRLTRWRWARYWPLLFMPFALFLLIIGEPSGWPLGKEGFWNTLISPQTLTHRLATLLVVLLGIFLLRVQLGSLSASKARLVFPLLCGVGGALLLTHSHSVFAIKWAFLIEASHNAIGVLAVTIGAGGWLEQQMPNEREGRIAGLIWPVCFVLVGLVLLFYQET